MALEKELSINLGLPNQPLTKNAELFGELVRVYNALKLIAGSLDKYTGVLGYPDAYWPQLGVGQCMIGLNSKIYIEAGETLTYGNTIGIKSDKKAWKAKDGVLRAIGFCSAPDGTTAGQTTEIQLIGIFPHFSPGTLTAGTFYYNSSTFGAIGVAGAAPTWAQIIGFAITDQILFYNPQY